MKRLYILIAILVGIWLLSSILVGLLPRHSASITLATHGKANAVIVAPKESGKVVAFAAKELKQFLDAATGADFAIVENVPKDGSAIVLGDCEEARRAGLDVKALKRDGFRILPKHGRLIFIAGRDDKDYDLDAYVKMEKIPPVNGRGWNNVISRPEYATLFGVYEFLERFVGIRFYYPGELGTCIPNTPSLSTPPMVGVTDNPAMQFRYSLGFGDHSTEKYTVWRMPDYGKIGITREESNLWALRCRQSTFYLPQNHGEGMLHWHKRFWEKEEMRRPELFAMKADGTRYAESQHKFSLCYTNPDVAKQMAEDARVFFSGRRATEMLNAPWNAEWVPDRAQGDYFSIFPNDHYGDGCKCERCMALVDAAFSSGQDANLPGEYVTNPREYSQIMWNYYRKVAESTLEEFPNKYYTTLAYGKWRAIPENIGKLPPNLLVGVTTIGNGNSSDHPAMKRIFEDIAAWSRIAEGGIWLWHYQINRPPYDGIPQPRLWAAGRFYNELAQYNNIIGVFYETEITHGFQHHLDIYLNHRLMWNPSLDANAVIDEYARRMYGAAAPEVIALLHIFEDGYLKGIVRDEPAGYSGSAYRDVVDWPDGRWPNDKGLDGLRRDVYPDARLQEIAALAARAKAKVPADSMESRRLRLFIDQFVGETLKKMEK